MLLHQRGDNEEAAKLLDRALGFVPDATACLSNRGLVEAALGDLPEAVACHERALAIDPAFGNARNSLGTVLQKQGRFDESIEQLELLLAQDPDFIDARLNLGSTLASAKRYDEALAVYRETLARKPGNFHAHFGEGNALRELKRFDEAIASLRRALALKPDHFEANVNLGTTLGLFGRFVEAEAQYRRALTLRDDPQIHVCVGAAIGSQGRFEEEEPYYRHALTLVPDHADALHNLALLELRRGHYKEGWALHEVRWRSSKYKPMNIPGVPEWRGESLQGKTLLVAGEEGHGDMMQFARHIPVLEQMGATVDMWVPENIVELIQSVRGVRLALQKGSTKGYDYWTPSMRSISRGASRSRRACRHALYERERRADRLVAGTCEKTGRQSQENWDRVGGQSDVRQRPIPLDAVRRVVTARGGSEHRVVFAAEGRGARPALAARLRVEAP